MEFYTCFHRNSPKTKVQADACGSVQTTLLFLAYFHKNSLKTTVKAGTCPTGIALKLVNENSKQVHYKKI
ncbi:hypothetical protein [Rufibacter sp. XAAS-G3-1]|uniref:hypothetical protein n=1 Tax=Rufibacter sp. XAAS-G3-1 TaxID=2729134 RepID=UPI0015E6AA1F|nr:hypothetical protein [Rufibacter sp. XAAS-G3-1]